MNNVDAFLRITDLVKVFGETVAVRAVNLSVKRNELFALLGSSGCGKSTLLRMLAGFEDASSGQILLDGEDITHVPPYRRPVNMMFQSYALFPHMSVEANVAFGLKQEGVAAAEIHERVFETLELVQMTQYARRKPHQLSGGQQQRVALARSLVKRPKLLLLDEPMSALDKQIRQKTQIELTKILQQVGVTCLMVTHDQEEAMTMAHRLAVMTDGQIVQSGTPQEVYAFPASRFVAGFIGMTVTREPPASDYNWTRGVVSHLAWLGPRALYQVRLDAGKTVEVSVPSLALAAADASDDAPGIDDEVFVTWGPDCATVLAS